MSIELKVGEWYETVDMRRCYVVADVSARLPMLQAPFVVMFPPSSPELYSRIGKHLDSRVFGDIARHLPECTGWDWVEPKPEKWRDATPEDAIRTPHPRCRARVASSGERTVYVYGELVGYYVSGAGSQWVVNAAGTVSNYSLCQVLDE